MKLLIQRLPWFNRLRDNMHDISFEEALDLIVSRDPRYSREAYLFVREALDHTQKHIARDRRGRTRHVTGKELLEGIRDYALSQYGPMAMMVLDEWGVHHCSDFGELVFNMVEVKLLAKTEQDTRADFQNGYEFYEAFRAPYLPSSKTAPRPVPAPSGN
jgi:uncharacterized repeat protein (TIGR04138 family)